MRALIIDDEKKAREGIKILLAEDPEVELLGEAENGKEAIDKISTLKPHLIFLDIQMPGINGFDVLGSIPENNWPIVIFSTAYDKYALRAFEVQALDYLLKPYSRERFMKSLNFAKKHFNNRQDRSLEQKLKGLLTSYQSNYAEDELIQSDSEDSQVIIKSKGKVYFIRVNDIYWIQALDSYVKIHLADGMHITKATLKSVESKYQGLTRIHRSHLINMEKVLFMEPYFNGDFYLILKNNEKVKGSRNYKDNLPQTF